MSSFDQDVMRERLDGRKQQSDELRTNLNKSMAHDVNGPAVNDPDSQFGSQKVADSKPPIPAKDLAFDFLRTVGNSATFGAGTGTEAMFDTLVKGGSLGENFENAIDRTKQSRENIGTALGIGADVAGGLMPGGLPKKLDDALSSAWGLGRQYAPEVLDWVKRLGVGGASGAAGSVAEEYALGERDLGSLVATAGLGGIFGTAGQGIVGELLGPAASKLFKSRGGDVALGTVLRHIAAPPGAPGADMAQIAAGVESGRPLTSLGDGTILTSSLGQGGLMQQWAGLNNFLADLSFGKSINPRKVNTPEVQAQLAQYNELVGAVKNARNQVVSDYNARLDVAVMGDTSRRQALEETRNKKAAAKQMYRRMAATVGFPGPDGTIVPPLGAQEVPTGKFLDHIEQRLPMYNDRRNMKETSLQTRTVYARFNDLLRGIDQEAVARDFDKIVSKGKNAKRADEVFANIPLATLMDARSSFAGIMSPSMAFSSGITREQLKVGRQILKEVDDYLDLHTHDAYGQARGEFAGAMREEEAYNLGKQLYRTKQTEMTDKEGFAKYHGDYVADAMENMTPKEQEMLAGGFRSAMSERMGQMGPQRELSLLLGEPQEGIRAGKERQGNVELLRTILGDPDTDMILAEFMAYPKSEEYTRVLLNNVTDSLPGSDADMKKIGTALERMGSGHTNAADSRIPGVAAVAELYNRILKPSDATRMRAAMSMMLAEGDEFNELAERGIRAITRMPNQWGTRSATAANEGTDAIRDYLMSIQSSAGSAAPDVSSEPPAQR